MKSRLKKLRKYLPYILAAVLTAVIFYVIYNHGYTNGANAKQLAWNNEKAQYEKTLKDMQDQMTQNENEHRLEQSRISSDLAEANKKHAVALATVRAEYASRLRDSSERASIYQRQAQAGTVEQRGLASHTAKLDLALVEGIALVRELTETIGLRDQQLILVGEQIQNDRRLIGDGTNERVNGIPAGPK